MKYYYSNIHVKIVAEKDNIFSSFIIERIIKNYNKNIKNTKVRSDKNMLSINTDFKADSGYPFTYFKDISEAGFFPYPLVSSLEYRFLYIQNLSLQRSEKQLDFYGLGLSDIHASRGVEKCWYSPC